MDAIAIRPPRAPLGARLRRRLFASPGATVVTLLLAALLGWAAWRLVEWGLLHAVAAPDYAACKALERQGACWGFVAEKWRLILFGRYPFEQQWRPAIATAAVVAMLLATAAPALWTRRGARVLAAGWVVAFAVFFALMAGGVLGLEPIGTDRWGGLPLTVILTLIGMAASTPIGIALALARRSSLGLLRSLAVGYIELVRGVPLITVLFVSAFIFPLVLPAGWRIDPFWRVAIGLVLFQAAYMAETVRGGLQGVPVEQEEAAYSLGLRWWQVQLFITLPQALRIVVPGIVNNVVDLFKDTSLVTIIGLVDLLGAVNQSLKDPAWLGLAKEGYVFTAVVFFVCCFGMSSYSRRFERRLNRHRTGGH